jgi:hypothetical protein
MYLVLDGSVVLGPRPSAPQAQLQQQQQQQQQQQLQQQLQQQQQQQQQQLAAGAAGAGGAGDSGAAKAGGKGERLAAKGDVFGEAGLFPGELGPWRRESATTLSRVSVYVLKAAALQEIADEYPEVRPRRRHARAAGSPRPRRALRGEVGQGAARCRRAVRGVRANDGVLALSCRDLARCCLATAPRDFS